MEVIVHLVLISAFCGLGMGAPATGQENCSVRFQEAVREALLLKKACGKVQHKDCCQITEVAKAFDYNHGAGVYEINNPCMDDSPFSSNFIAPIQARCNMESNNGGWVVLMRRTPEESEQTSFNRGWDDYENGFGNLTGEFWYGLKNMHCVTTREEMEVEIKVSKIDGTTRILSYGSFKIDGPSTNYTLHISEKQHEGNDPFAYHNGMKFTTIDRDNDKWSGNCAVQYNKGGWWFKTCYQVHLTDVTKAHLPHRTLWDYAEIRVRSKTCSASLSTGPTCQ